MAKKMKDPEMNQENPEMIMDPNADPELAEYMAQQDGELTGDEADESQSEGGDSDQTHEANDDSYSQTGSEYPPEAPGEASFPQTGSEDSLDDPEEAHSSQTDSENPENLAEAPGIPDDATQSDSEAPDDAREHPEEPENASDEDVAPQTGSETTDVVPPEAQNASESDSAGDDGDEPEKPKRGRGTRKKPTDADDDAIQDTTAGGPDNDTTQSQKDSTDESKPRARRRRRTAPIVSIDEQRSVETDADKLRNDLLDLVESMKGRKVLTGTIQGVERSADNPNISFAVVYHGDFKIIIPADETVEAPADFRDRLPGDVMHYLVTKRLGAEIDFIVKGVDDKSGIAAASRLEAMASKRKEYYFGTDRDGNNLLYEGIAAEARIVSVIRAGMFVDLFGVETYIALRELSYQRWVDATQHYQPGQRVLVKILSIDRSNRNKIIVQASVKQAGENPYEKALRRYSVGSRYVGTVSMVDTNGVFVSLDGGIDCLCSYPKRGRPPRGSRVTVRILGINNETNRIWGAITHMTGPR